MIEANRWYHVVATIRGSEGSIYVNGALDVRGSRLAPAGVDSAPLTFGFMPGRDGGGYFPGQLDEIAIYNRALSATEIEEHYRVGTQGTSSLPTGVLNNDFDPEGDAFEAVLVSDATNGTLALASNGSFSYTPNDGFAGVDTFTYVATDAESSSNVATVTIRVNAAPVAENDAYDAAEDNVLAVDATLGVLANDEDPNDDAMTATLVSGPAHGSVELASDGSFTYTPEADFFGDDAFTYRASDGTIESNVATVTISVAGDGEPPVAVDDEFALNQGDTLGGIGEFPPGVELFEWTENGHFYGLVTDSGTWAASRDKAAALTFRGTPGHLLTVGSAGENAFIIENILSLAGSTQRVLIGLTDEISERSFRWVTGEPLTYTNWDKGEPNDSFNEDFVEYSRATGRGWHWNDTNGGGS